MAGEFVVAGGLLEFVGAAATPDVLAASGVQTAWTDPGNRVVAGTGPILPDVGDLEGFTDGSCDAETGSTLEETLCTVTGPMGLVVIAVYSFLVAVALPFPGELVLAPVGQMRLGLSTEATVALVVLVSASAKTLGSLVAFHLGQEVKRAGPVARVLRRSRFDVVGWSKRRSVAIARRYGYVGLAALLSVPGFPHTIPIYAFSVLDDDYRKFALATFTGSAARLVITASVVGGAIAVL